jgi:hypothetical protein
MKRLFQSRNWGTFLSAFSISAITFLTTYSIYVENNSDSSLVKSILNVYTSMHGWGLAIFTPLIIGIFTTLFVHLYSVVRKSLSDYKIPRFLANVGLFFSYLGLTFFAIMIVFYLI